MAVFQGQGNSYVDQKSAERTGENWQQLGIWSGILIVGTILLLIGYWYGYVIYPRDVLLEQQDPAQPLVEEIPLDVMPLLPDNLAQIYDQVNAAQVERLNTFGVTDVEADIVSIPLDDAIDLMLERGMPDWSDLVAPEAAPTDE
ncbi:MAG: hypothetical protein GYB68_16830 [Chloroflexi bacterium]|nr:hypothetical protein [Chloroflexota bacterium]